MPNLRNTLTQTECFVPALITGDFMSPSVDRNKSDCHGLTFGRPQIKIIHRRAWTQIVNDVTRLREGQNPSTAAALIMTDVHQIDVINHLALLRKSGHILICFHHITS